MATTKSDSVTTIRSFQLFQHAAFFLLAAWDNKHNIIIEHDNEQLIGTWDQNSFAGKCFWISPTKQESKQYWNTALGDVIDST